MRINTGALSLAGVLTLGACASSAGAPDARPTDPAALLYQRDATDDVNGTRIAGDYSTALDAWQAKCREDRQRMPATWISHTTICASTTSRWLRATRS